MDLQLNSSGATIIPNDDTVFVTLEGVCIEEIIPQFTADELLEAITKHYGFSTVFDWTTEKRGEDEEN